MLAATGDFFWRWLVNPFLLLFAASDLAFFRRTRGLIRLVLLAAIVLLPMSYFYSPGRLLTASGLLFDIAGAVRLFVLEEIEDALSGFKPNKYGNLPSVANRELVMPEGGPFNTESWYMSHFYYKRRGVLFLFIGFVLQLAGALV